VTEDGRVVPAIRDRARLEAQVNSDQIEIDGTVANVTPEELWVGVDASHRAHLLSLSSVRIVLIRFGQDMAWADTQFRRLVGTGGRVAVLWRPASWSSDQRRVHSRVDLRLPAYIQPTGPQAVGSAWTTNLSVSGFHCITNLPLELGLRYGVSLAVSPLTKISCEAQVVRIDEDPEDPEGKLLVAFKFLELTEADEVELAVALAALDVG
jgi:c-di-GMP-binding flagellar brake protein YcgR